MSYRVGRFNRRQSPVASIIVAGEVAIGSDAEMIRRLQPVCDHLLRLVVGGCCNPNATKTKSKTMSETKSAKSAAETENTCHDVDEWDG